MKIVVCVKPVPDTAANASIDPQTKSLNRNAHQTILNPFDEFALEAALRLRDADAGHSITVVALAPAQAKEVVRKALAMGADDAVQITDDSFAGSDGAATARILAAAIHLLGFDLVLCGAQSADGGGGYVPTMLAELLDVPAMPMLRSLKAEAQALSGERSVDGMISTLTCEVPLLASISKEFPAPRYASLKGIMAAKKKEIRVLDRHALGLTDPAPISEVLAVAIPPVKQRGRTITTNDPVAAAHEIIAFLQERHAL